MGRGEPPSKLAVIIVLLDTVSIFSCVSSRKTLLKNFRKIIFYTFLTTLHIVFLMTFRRNSSKIKFLYASRRFAHPPNPLGAATGAAILLLRKNLWGPFSRPWILILRVTTYTRLIENLRAVILHPTRASESY